jgi:NADPH-dependent 2,4-dienoyl-CoA reductase/sulfur reductase-like enzyme
VAFDGSAGRVARVRLSDGSAVEADLVVIGIGVRPCTDWLHGSGATLRDGVVCDASCATELPDVVAAGDVARWTNPRFDEAMRVEHWSNAVEMANHAVRRLLGGPEFIEPFAPVPYFWSDQFDVKLQFAGRLKGGDELAVIERAEAPLRLCVLFGHAGRLNAVLTFNRPQLLVRYRRQIAEGVSFEHAVTTARAG